ncbi:beta-phosphoglucomutase [Catalinimonas alkaloidigena]|uniref:HAD family hydrolase n=1 Tax=Catalinimonas alkaloidigena TaxID=1075417 RepID=UPI002404DC1E|nr:HAD family phosphatase [Catalinimonas alkaloidigena]MDF9799820.1 beta-phosphoglucomutase [Catalinimonas alkaloidigena]
MNSNLAIIFDMDGVIVDNHQFHLKSWLQFFEEHNISMTEEEYKQKVNGRTMEEILTKIMGKDLSKQKLRDLGEEKEKVYRDMYRPHIKATDGLPEFLEELKVRNVPRAVATSAPPPNVDFTMENTGLRLFFSTIIDDTMVNKGKPDPEVYLTAAKKLDMKPEQCIVFEDAILGIQAGKNAGMKVIAVATTHSREELEAGEADYVVDDFMGLTVEKLYAELKL